MSKIKKFGIALLPVLTFGVFASQASADITYTSQIATTTALVGAIGGDLLQTVSMAIGVVLGIAVLLVGIGYAWRKLKSKAVGKAF